MRCLESLERCRETVYHPKPASNCAGANPPQLKFPLLWSVQRSQSNIDVGTGLVQFIVSLETGGGGVRMNFVMITMYGSAILLLVLWVFLWFVHILALVYGFVVFFILLHNIPPWGQFTQPYLLKYYSKNLNVDPYLFKNLRNDVKNIH